MVPSGKTWTILGYITQERTPKNPFSRFQNHHIQDFVQERKIYTIYSTYIGQFWFSASHSTVYHYLRHSINVYPYKRQRIPRLTNKMMQNRLDFALKHKNWTVTDWEKVLWSDESPFQLFAPPNRQNDQVWSRSSADVQPFKCVKFPAKIQVWGMMSHQALSELHIIPQKQNVNGEYYREKILKGTCMDAIRRTANSGTILERSMIEKMSESIFMQDGAPAHTAKLTQAWCSEHLPSYWAKVDWPGNSPDLNPIENLWSILAYKLSKLPEVSTINSLVIQLKKVWSGIDPVILQNLTNDMPNRISEIINRSGDYIGKKSLGLYCVLNMLYSIIIRQHF